MRVLIAVALVFFVVPGVFALAQMQGHQAMQGQQACQFCGMDRHKFAHSAMLIEYEDGSTAATCSLHCAAIDLATNIDKTPRIIQVGDYDTKQLINAENACWTLGGDVPGVMSKRAKWAFGNKADCEKFSKEHGAQMTTFDDAMKSAYEDMYSDTKMIRDKRKAMREKQGQKKQ
jgi:copper chaperone NosL